MLVADGSSSHGCWEMISGRWAGGVGVPLRLGCVERRRFGGAGEKRLSRIRPVSGDLRTPRRKGSPACWRENALQYEDRAMIARRPVKDGGHGGGIRLIGTSTSKEFLPPEKTAERSEIADVGRIQADGRNVLSNLVAGRVGPVRVSVDGA